MKCPKCGKENLSDAKFCDLCFERFELNAEGEKKNSYHPEDVIVAQPKKRKSVLIFFISLILIGLIAFGIRNTFNNKSATPSASSSQSSSPLSSTSQRELPLTKKALESLKKLSAHTKGGISYINWGPARADTIYNVDNFLKSSETNIVPPEIKNNTIEAMDDYEKSNTLWNYKFISDGVDEFIKDSDLHKLLGSSVSKYQFDNSYPYHSEFGWNIDHCVSVIWSHASQCIERADQEFNSLP